MYWAYAGYVSAFYFGSALVGLWVIPNHTNPVKVAWGLFIFMPLLVMAISAEPVVTATAFEKEQVRTLFQDGRMSRGRAFRGGFMIGVLAIGSAIGIWFGLPLLIDIGWWLGLVSSFPILFGACVVLSWLVGLARKRKR